MLSKEEILHIASLARIGLSEKEVEMYQHDLSAVLDYFSELQKLDTENVQPIGHITGMKNKTRRDEMADVGMEEKKSIIRNAPETKDGYIKVKSVL